jgi:hypothetical protein
MVVSRLRRESCQQYRQAAGAVAEALIGADWTRHHTTTDSTLAVFRGRGCIDSLRLYPHAQTEKKATDFVVSGAGRTSTRLFCSRRRKGRSLDGHRRTGR